MRKLILVVLSALCLNAQWLNYPDPRTPRTKEGKPNLTAPAPRANGKPDLSGVWEADVTPRSELDAVLGAAFFDLQIDVPRLNKYVVNLLWDFKPADDPSRPETLALLKQRSNETIPGSHCLPNSIPITPLLLPFKIVQTPQQMVMIFEHYDPPRQIYTDGRSMPKSLDPSWAGYSIGKWQGDTMIVESAGFNGKTWLDAAGHPRGASAHLTERYRRPDFGHMSIDFTVDDPQNYKRPFTVKLPFHLIPDSDVLEAVCMENEKDQAHVRN